MSVRSRRVALTPGYLLHHRPWRDTSRILEVLTREHGRLTLFARGVRGPHAKLAAVLQPFQPLLLSWSGRGEAAQLTGAERAAALAPLAQERLLAGFYLNELLLKLTTRHDALPELFDHYHATLEELRRGTAALAAALRVFEKRLLEILGYGIDLATEARSGSPIRPDAYYEFHPGVGLLPARAGDAGSVCGHSVLSLAHERLQSARELEDARRLLQAALGACLEGRPLATSLVARAMKRGASA
ncbi:MAG: DNA repair protein RecO [Gammaproteobacteria bacterium]|nr:DNA repair protein RecO [Gammaproteobacteria bacterium]MBV8974506.1 DNA repair protein RecO [Nevskiaceae bacterium]MBV9317757.1 DNA repair protein RecO [Gammaproteobacteria bacterium]